MTKKHPVLKENENCCIKVASDALLRVKFMPQCFIKFRKKADNLYSEEVLNYIFMPVSCGTFYTGNVFL